MSATIVGTYRAMAFNNAWSNLACWERVRT